MDTIYLLHHSHTDIGFTHEQPVVMDLHARIIDQAIDYCEQTADFPDGSALKWTCEVVGPFLHWLRRRPDRQIDRFLRLARAGRIELTGMFAVMSQCSPHESMYRQMEVLADLRKDYGLKISTALQCDINGHNWGLVEALRDCGIDGFAMAINENVGRAAFNHQRPNGFYWEGFSGDKILTWNGLHYNCNNFFHFPGEWERVHRGQPTDYRRAVDFVPRYLEWLEKRNYPYPFAMFQVTYTTFVDNGPADRRLSEFVRWWNRAGHAPRMQIVTLREFFDVLRRQPDRLLPTHCGEWTDYWNFGATSTAYETALNRRTYHRLFEGELALSLTRTPPRQELAEAWENAYYYDEHTWGANTSVLQPFRQAARSQLNQKLNYAYRARSLAQAIRLEAIDRVARSLGGRDEGYHVMALNPLPWARTERLLFPAAWLETDAAGSISHVAALDRLEASEQQGMGDQELAVSRSVRVPSLGYRLFSAADLAAEIPAARPRKVARARAENAWFRIELDARRGGIRSLFDRKRRLEWVDKKYEYSLGGYVYEQVAGATESSRYGGRMKIFEEADWTRFMGYRGWHADWPAVRQSVSRVVEQTVATHAGFTHLRQRCEAPGTRGVTYEITVGENQPWIDLKVTIDKLWNTAPEACYLAFPFAVPGALPRYQTAGGAVRPHLDQLPGCNQDFHTAQGWADLSNATRGVTVTTADAPIVMFGGFNLAQMFDRPRKRIPSRLLSLVMTNYYHVNYAGGQHGDATFHYRIAPHGAFDQVAANRLGLEAAFPLVCHPVLNPRGKNPSHASLVTLSHRGVSLLAAKPSRDGKGVAVRLYNPLEKSCDTSVASPFLGLREAWLCDNLENPVRRIIVKKAAFRARIPSGATQTYRLVP